MDLTKVWAEIVETANRSVQREEDDYVENGLLYCGKCHTPKQAKIELFNETFMPLCLCACATEKRDREIAEQKKKERLERIEENRRRAFPDLSYIKHTFEEDDKGNSRLSDIAERYVKNFESLKDKGKGLLLFGGVGTGKTFIASCIVNSLIDKGYRCLVTNMPRIINTVGGTYDGRQEYIDSLNRYDLLVIDDLSAERDTEFSGEIVNQVIDSRYRSGLPLIVTTNLTSSEIKNPADVRKQRLYSRLMEMCVPVEVKGKDRRKEKLNAEYGEMKELLGL